MKKKGVFNTFKGAVREDILKYCEEKNIIKFVIRRLHSPQSYIPVLFILFLIHCEIYNITCCQQTAAFEFEVFPYFTGMGFLEWYESYFREIIADHDVGAYGYYSLKSEEELRNSYKPNLSLKEKKELMKGFYKFKRVEEETLNQFFPAHFPCTLRHYH